MDASSRRPPRRTWAVAAVLAVATVLAGCAGEKAPPAVPVAPADTRTAVDCTAEWDVGWGSIPEDFEPIAVYVCDPLLGIDPPTGDDGEVVGRLPSTEPQRLEGDLAPLVAAFAEPNDPPWPGPCAASMVIVPDVWLVDDAGRAIRPAYPVTSCSQPKEGVGEALALLTPVR